MARDRKRAKQRKERQARSGGQPRHAPELPGAEHQHESGEVDVAEAQVALGRPELADDVSQVPDAVDDVVDLPELADEGDFEQLEDRVDDAEERFEQQLDEGRNGHDEGGAEVVRRRRRASQPAERGDGNRFANFLRGSWHELQRVQWPDRQQVGQATAVVIGFVIVAGAFLGFMDYVAAKIVDLIV